MIFMLHTDPIFRLRASFGTHIWDSEERVPGTRVEHAPNSEYAPISEMRLITRDYGMHILVRLHHKQLGFLERMKKLCRTEGYSLHVPKCLRTTRRV